MKTRAVGYVGLQAQDIEAWRSFASEVLGLQVLPDTDEDRLCLKMDDYRSRIFIESAEQDGIAYVGLELPNGPALKEAVAELEAAGIEVRPGTEAEQAARGVGAMAVLADPAGVRVELFVSPTLDYDFTSPHGAKFVTGETGELGFGHVVLVTGPDTYDPCREFYSELLGFGVSEYASLGPIEITFMHCNARHHSLALAKGPFSMCHHIMLEVDSLDTVGRGLDRAEAAKVPITLSLGRHRNDQMVSFYMRSPSGVEVEFGTGARLIDPQTWSVSEWVGGDVWGHRGIENVSL